MLNASNLSSLIKTESVFFFAGAGISLASDAPSVSRILRITAKMFLPDEPDIEPLNSQVVLGKTNQQRVPIQPELFYEVILSIMRDDRCVGLWESLSNTYLESFNYRLEPNINHIALVDYSAKSGFPIFTTNFDGLFEKAAEFLGIEYEVVLPYTVREIEICQQIIDAPNAKTPLYIFKPHGSADNLPSIRTTMHSISSRNWHSLELIADLSRRSHLTFVGYSGRDIDIFPSVADTDGRRACYWFDPKKDISNRFIQRAKATNVNEYPDDFFRREFPVLASKALPSSSVKWEEVFAEIQTSILNNIDVQPIDRISILGACLHITGDNDDACNIFSKHQEAMLSGPDAVKTGVSQYYYSKALDSVGKYITAEKICRDALTATAKAHSEAGGLSKDAHYDSVLVRLDYQRAMAKKQRAGPTVRFGDRRTDWRPSIFTILRITFDYIVTIFRMRQRLNGLGDNRNELHVVHARHAYSDHQIVLVAILLSSFQVLGLDRTRLCRGILSGWLGRIESNAHDFGDYFSLAGVGKYYLRIGVMSWEEKTVDLLGLITNPLNQALLFRDRGEKAISNGQMEEAREAFNKSYRLAEICGSRPTQLKALLGCFAAGEPIPNLKRRLR